MAVRAFEDWLGCRAEQKAQETASAFFEMIHMYRQYDDEPKVGGGLIAAFLLLLLSCLGAFAAAGGGIFEPAPPAQMMVAPGKLERVLGRDLLPQDTATRETRSPVTASTKAATICNYDDCERAYQSFRSSDCTFQPYDGPRRLCRK